MKMKVNECIPLSKSFKVQVTLDERACKGDWIPCVVGKAIEFKTEDLERYCLSDWDPLVRDLLLLAAAVEFCDRSFTRPPMSWGRSFHLRIPVEDPSRFSGSAEVSLHRALELLTGDSWRINFEKRPTGQRIDKQRSFHLEEGDCVVMPFSEGLDSYLVAALWRTEKGPPATLVRLGGRLHRSGKQPFVSVPYKVRTERPNQESSGRSRGFKFAVLCGVAAYLKNASRIIVSESGQGALAPVLISVGQIHPDYRNHPLFMKKMSAFFNAVMDRDIAFEFPRLWYTKGETLREFQERCEGDWQSTRSCWQGNKWVSLDGKRRQCGICAACMLRRLSVHAAGGKESSTSYVISDLAARSLSLAAAPGFHKLTESLWQYALAGVLHMEHLACYRSSPAQVTAYHLRVLELASCMSLSVGEVGTLLDRLLRQHESEWQKFLAHVGAESFVNRILDGSA